MKKISFLFVATIATFMCLNSVYANFPKVPLLEKFTNTGCGYCASYNNSVFNAWKNANKNNLAIISYHWYFPSQADPMYQFAKNLGVTRAEHYSVNGVPTLFFEGVEIGGGQPSGPQLSNALNAELSKMVPVKITPTITVSGGTATVNVEVLSTQAMSGVRLQVLILQEQISFTTAPGSNGEKEFSFVARFALPNITGENLTLNANQAVTKQHTANLNSIPQSGRFYVVAFLETISPHSIVQTGISGFTEHIIAKPQKPVTVQVSQSAIYSKVPAGTNATHTFTITNTSNFPIKVATTVEQGEWTTAGLPANINIAANASETVTITANSPNTSAVNYIAVDLLAERSGTANDTNYVPAESSALYFAMTDKTKYAYIIGSGISGAASYIPNINSFAKATHFEGNLVVIPFWHSSLFTTNFLDDLEFLGITIDNSNNANATALFSNLQITAKLSSLTKTRMYFSAAAQFAIANANQQNFPNQVKAVRDFYSNFFSVKNDAANPVIGLVGNQGQVLKMPVSGVANDPISNNMSFTVNDASSNEYPFFSRYVDYYQIIDNSKVSAVLNFVESGTNYPVLVKYEDKATNQKRVLSGFDFQGVPPASIDELTNSIVNWLFPPPPEYTVTIAAINPAGSGSVSGAGGPFPANSSVTLTATPTNANEYKFKNWTDANGAVISEANPYIFTITKDIVLNANFELIPTEPQEFTVTIGAINPAGAGTVEGADGPFPAHSSVTLTATPTDAEEYEFKNWTDANGAIISVANPYTFTITKDMVLNANFNVLSIKDEHISLNSFFPNPAKDYLTIDLKENATVKIFTLDGIKLFEETRAEGLSNINFTVPVGTYILRTETPKGSAATKFIVE